MKRKSEDSAQDVPRAAPDLRLVSPDTGVLELSVATDNPAGEKSSPPKSEPPAAAALSAVPAGQTIGQAGHTTLISPRILDARLKADQAKQPEPPSKRKPVVGWLVIVGGPGRGQTFPLTYGLNPVGSHVEQGVRLTFGDLQVADTQALVIYDHQRRKFLLHHKGGRMATFLNGEPVLKLTAVGPNQEIVMGRTKLRLVPLCGPDFDWTQK